MARRDRTDKELYRYLRMKERNRRPRIWPWVVLAVVLLVLLSIWSKVRIIWIW